MCLFVNIFYESWLMWIRIISSSMFLVSLYSIYEIMLQFAINRVHTCFYERFMKPTLFFMFLCVIPCFLLRNLLGMLDFLYLGFKFQIFRPNLLQTCVNCIHARHTAPLTDRVPGRFVFAELQCPNQFREQGHTGTHAHGLCVWPCDPCSHIFL